MNTYFCPQCGRSYDASECIEDNTFLRCPFCPDSRVMWRGRVLVTLGLLVVFIATLLPAPYIPALGIMIGGGLCVTGFVRSIRQRRARRRREREEDGSDFPEEELEDF